jgi:N-methylhydantoinase A/oxoprolinase/acetone carboxylase beta subunit
VLIPRLAAVYSAYGIAYSNISYEYRSTLTTTDGLERNGVQEALLAQAARDMFAEGIELEDCDLQWQWQQAGQSYELKSAGDALPASAEITDGELVLTAAKPLGRVAAPGKAEWSCSDAIVADTRVLDLPDGLGEVPVYRVDQQVAGASGSGPCIIEEDFYTCRVLPDWQFEFTDQCDILLRKRDNGKAS